MSEEIVDTAPVEETAPATDAPAPVDAPTLRDTFKAKVGDDAFKSFEKYSDDDSLVNGILSAQSMIGKKGDIPAEDADAETYKEFWGKLGSENIKIDPIELGDEFGAITQDLKDVYGGITESIQDIAKEEIAQSKNIPDLMNRIVGRYLKEDAERARLGAVEQKEASEKQFAATAGKTGLSTDQLKAVNEEVIKQNGWDESTSIAEVLYTLSKATTNSNTMKEAHLNNTNEGLDAQIQSITASGDLDTIGPKHDIALKKKKDLLRKKAELAERG